MTNMVDERRDFFRIDDSLRIGYQLVSQEDLPGYLEHWPGGDEKPFTAMSTLSAISQQVSGYLRRIETKEPDVANYLKALDAKINILGQALLAQASNNSNQSTQVASLSGSGLSFECNDMFEPGAILELKLLLLPSFTGVLVLADVICCDPLSIDEGVFDFRVRVKFSHIQEQDRNTLIQHIVQRQSEDLKARREARDGDDQ